MYRQSALRFFFFFNDTATTEIYTLSLHDALPICDEAPGQAAHGLAQHHADDGVAEPAGHARDARSEEHTSELQSRLHLVCRLLLEKKKKQIRNHPAGRIDHMPGLERSHDLLDRVC